MRATREPPGFGRRLAVAGGLVLVPVAVLVAFASPVLAANHSIAIVGQSYLPGSLSIQVNDVVVWENNDPVAHTVTAPGVFDFGPIPAGGSHAVSFGQAGTWEYGCTIHPEMSGTITVRAGGATAPAPTTEPTPGAVAGATSGPTVTAAPTDALDARGGGSIAQLALMFAAIAATASVAFGLAVFRLRQIR